MTKKNEKKFDFFPKSSIFSRKSSIFSRKSSIFPQNLYKFDLGISGVFSVARLGFSIFPQNLYKFDLVISGVFSVARLGFSIFLEWQHCQRQCSRGHFAPYLKI